MGTTVNETINANVMEGLLTWKQLDTMDSFLTDLSIKIKRAEYIMQDITEGYFGIAPDKLKEEAWKLHCDYERCGTKAEIVGDYLYQLREEVRKAEEKLQAELEKYRQRKEQLKQEKIA